MRKSADKVSCWAFLLEVLAGVRRINPHVKFVREQSMKELMRNRGLLTQFEPSVNPLFGLKCRHSVRFRHAPPTQPVGFAWKFFEVGLWWA